MNSRLRWPSMRLNPGQLKSRRPQILRRVTAPFEIAGKMLQVGSYAGIARAKAAETRSPICFAAPTSRLSALEVRALLVRSGSTRGWSGRCLPMSRSSKASATLSTINNFCRFSSLWSTFRRARSTVRSARALESSAQRNCTAGSVHSDRRGARPDFAAVRAGHCKCSAYRRVVAQRLYLVGQHLTRPVGGSMACATSGSAAAEANFPAHRLVIEITESSLFSDLDLARSIAISSRTRESGCRSTTLDRLFLALAPAFAAIRYDQDRPLVHRVNCFRPESAAIVRAVARPRACAQGCL